MLKVWGNRTMKYSKRVRRKIGALFLSLLLLMHTFAASAASANWQPRLTIDGRIGTVRSSGTIQIMTPLMQNEDRMLFADLRGVASTDRSTEGNLGIGYRWIPQGGSSIYGAYVFADRRRTASGNLWDQVTAGFEVIGVDTDFRINAYVPRTGRQLLSWVTDDDLLISGTTLIYQDAILKTYETAMSGFDIGVNHRLSGAGNDTRLGLRGFHFTADDVASVTGGNIRIETRYRDVLNLEGSELILGLEGQTDTVRGGQGFVTVGFSVPFGAGNVKARSGERELADRMMEPVQRDIDIVVSKTDPEREVQHHSDPIDVLTDQKVTGILFVSADGSADAEGDPDDPLNVEGANARLADAADDGVAGVLVVAIGENDIHTGDDGLVLMPGNILLSKGNLVFASSETGRRLTFGNEDPTNLVNDADKPVVVVSGDNRIIGIETAGGAYSIYGDGIDGALLLESIALSGASDTAINLRTDVDGALRLLITESDISGNRGIDIDLNDADSAGVVILDSSVRALDGAALTLDGSAAQDVTYSVANSTITSADLGSGERGILLVAEAGGDIAYTFTHSEISSVKSAELYLQADGSGSIIFDNVTVNVADDALWTSVEAEGNALLKMMQSSIELGDEWVLYVDSNDGGASIELEDISASVEALSAAAHATTGDNSFSLQNSEITAESEAKITLRNWTSGGSTVEIFDSEVAATGTSDSVEIRVQAFDDATVHIAASEGGDRTAQISTQGRLVVDAESLGDGRASILIEGAALSAAGSNGDIELVSTSHSGGASIKVSNGVLSANDELDVRAHALTEDEGDYFGDFALVWIDDSEVEAETSAYIGAFGLSDATVYVSASDSAEDPTSIEGGDVTIEAESQEGEAAIGIAGSKVISSGDMAFNATAHDDNQDAFVFVGRQSEDAVHTARLTADANISFSLSGGYEAHLMVDSAELSADAGMIDALVNGVKGAYIASSENTYQAAGGVYLNTVSDGSASVDSAYDDITTENGEVAIAATSFDDGASVTILSGTLTSAAGSIDAGAFGKTSATVEIDGSESGQTFSAGSAINIIAASESTATINIISERFESAGGMFNAVAIADANATVRIVDSDVNVAVEGVPDGTVLIQAMDFGVGTEDGNSSVEIIDSGVVAGENIDIAAMARGNASIDIVTTAEAEEATSLKTLGVVAMSIESALSVEETDASIRIISESEDATLIEAHSGFRATVTAATADVGLEVENARIDVSNGVIEALLDSGTGNIDVTITESTLDALYATGIIATSSSDGESSEPAGGEVSVVISDSEIVTGVLGVLAHGDQGGTINLTASEVRTFDASRFEANSRNGNAIVNLLDNSITVSEGIVSIEATSETADGLVTIEQTSIASKDVLHAVVTAYGEVGFTLAENTVATQQTGGAVIELNSTDGGINVSLTDNAVHAQESELDEYEIALGIMLYAFSGSSDASAPGINVFAGGNTITTTAEGAEPGVGLLLHLISVDAGILVNIEENTIDSSGFGVFVNTHTAEGDTEISVTENAVTAGASALVLDLNVMSYEGNSEAGIDVTVTDNELSAVNGDAVVTSIVAENGEVTVVIEDNTVTSTEGDGLSFNVMSNDGDVSIDVVHNTVDVGNDGVSMDVQAEDGDVDLEILGNTVEAGHNGVSIDVTTRDGDVEVELTTSGDNAQTITAANAGVHAEIWTGKGDVSLSWTENAVTAGMTGFEALIGVNEAAVGLDWSGNTITGGFGGMSGTIVGSYVPLGVQVQGNTVAASESGIALGVLGDAADALVFGEVDISGNALAGTEEARLETGIETWVSSGAEAWIDYTIYDNVIEATAAGVLVQVYTEYDGGIDLIAEGNVIGAPEGETLDEGMRIGIEMNGDGYMDVDLEANTIDAYWEGVAIDAAVRDTGTIEITFYDNTISADWAPVAIDAEGAGWGYIDIALVENTIVGNAGREFNSAYGVYIDVAADDDAYVQMLENEITVEGASGIHVNVEALGDWARVSFDDNNVKTSKNGIAVFVDSLDSWVEFNQNYIWSVANGIMVTAGEDSYVELDVIENIFRAIEQVVMTFKALDGAEIEWYMRDNEYKFITFGDQAKELVVVEEGSGRVYEW